MNRADALNAATRVLVDLTEALIADELGTADYAATRDAAVAWSQIVMGLRFAGLAPIVVEAVQ